LNAQLTLLFYFEGQLTLLFYFEWSVDITVLL
jgi:hypothetical protein